LLKGRKKIVNIYCDNGMKLRSL